ncbi:DUF6221 family protein [Streptomyces anulatus]|uniref:DUF6221 family protein n=1 Tax=Streptomyces anulatus TaxID=1892 RepID=UPI003684E2B9
MTADAIAFIKARLDEEAAAIASKRRLLSSLPELTDDDRAAVGEFEDQHMKLADAVLHVLALPYSEHSDYNPGWRDRGN